jgi:thiol-disulfide isomerase/thioredoxin
MEWTVNNRFIPCLTLTLILGSLAPSLILNTSNQAFAESTKAAAGSPLAKELQGKPTVAEIYADWCPFCKAAAPTLSSLKDEYKGKVNFVDLDITNRSTSQQAEVTAKKLGLGSFFEMSKSTPGTLVIINPATGEILRQFRGNDNKAEYVQGIKDVMAQIK